MDDGKEQKGIERYTEWSDKYSKRHFFFSAVPTERILPPSYFFLIFKFYGKILDPTNLLKG